MNKTILSLATAGESADEIVAQTGCKIIDAEQAVRRAQREQSIDVDNLWRADTSDIPAPTAERFQELFEQRDRDGLCMLSLHLVRMENCRTPKYLREDCEMFAIRKALEAIDELLSRDNSGNVRAYLNQVIKGALCDARTGRKIDARNSVSSATRKVRPKPKATDARRDALVSEMRNRGMSPQLIEAELDSLGLKPGPQLCKPVGQWPVNNLRDDDRHYSGESPLLEFGESVEPDEWSHLAEILSEEEYHYCKLRATGLTQKEIKDEFNVTIRQQQAIFESAQAKIQAAR